jgi:hypothetical protein
MKAMKISKKEYSIALCSLVMDKRESSLVRQVSLAKLFRVKADGLIEYEGRDLTKLGKNLPLTTMRNLVGLAYGVVLKKLNRTDPNTIQIFNKAIQHLSEHELKLEWEAIVDGTISNIVETMLNWEGQTDTVKQDIVSIFEGLAEPYFNQYKGNVPKEDLEWAHQQIREYFQGLKRKQPALEGKKETPSLKGGKKKALPPPR